MPLVPSPTGQKQFAQDWSSSTRKYNIIMRPYPGANTPNGLWTKYKVCSSQATGRMVTFSSTTQTRGDTSADSNTREGPPKDKPSVGHIVISYTQGLVESIKKICGKYGIQAHFMVNRTWKQLWVKPKVQDPMDNKSGAIYMYQCGYLACKRST